MIASSLSVRSSLGAIFVLMAGSGLLSTLIAVRLEIAGLPSLIVDLAVTRYPLIGRIEVRRKTRAKEPSRSRASRI